MTLDLDSYVDNVVSALRIIGRQGTNALLGEEVVRATYGFPIALEQIPQVQLPSLSIARRSSRLVPRGPGGYDMRWRFELVYIATATPYLKLDPRWPLLKQVHDALLIGCRSGRFQERVLLEEAGIVHVFDETWTSTLNFATDGSLAYPALTISFEMLERKVDTTEYAEARELFLRQLNPDMDIADQPQLESLHRNEEAIAAGDAEDEEPFAP